MTQSQISQTQIQNSQTQSQIGQKGELKLLKVLKLTMIKDRAEFE